MEKVAEFIQLKSPDRKLPLLCRVAEKNFRRGNTVAIHASDEDQAEQIDGKLWTFSQNSFVPHAILERAREPVIEPVLIVFGDEQVPDSDVLMIASGRRPDGWLGRFPHVYDFAEIYDQDLRLAARERYKKYQEAGYRMKFIR